MKEKILYSTNGMRYNNNTNTNNNNDDDNDNNNNMVRIRGRTCSCEQASEVHRLLGGFLFFVFLVTLKYEYNLKPICLEIYIQKYIHTYIHT